MLSSVCNTAFVRAAPRVVVRVRPQNHYNRVLPSSGRWFSAVATEPHHAHEHEPEEQDENELQKNLRPSEIVKKLDDYVVGQHDAKRAVAIALRNRWRRRLLPDDIRKEIMPKNVLLVGPTGN
mgnify:CR=1 FL=1